MYEYHHQPLATRRVFVRRLTKNAIVASGLVFGTLSVGMAGYHWLEGLAWIDAYLNAAMILGGMGPVDELHTSAGKIFAGSYALFAGIVFIVGVGIVFAPVVHRALHRFHLRDEDSSKTTHATPGAHRRP